MKAGLDGDTAQKALKKLPELHGKLEMQANRSSVEKLSKVHGKFEMRAARRSLEKL